MAKKKKSKNKIFYLLGGVVLVLLLFVIIGKNMGWVGQKKKIEVEIAEASFASIVERVSASGTVKPVVEVKISPEVSGEIIELAIEEGDSVSKGDFLLKLRPDNFKSALERANANLNQQQANLAQVRSNQARAEAGFSRAEQDFLRQKNLFAQKVISESDFQLAEANFKIAKQDLESAKQSVLAAQYIIKSSRATVDESKENLKLTSIVAPMSGIVSKLPVEEGETVLGTSQFQGTEVLRIADLSRMEVRVDVNENDIIRISVGDTAIIDVDSYAYMDKTFKGIVTQIANSANDKVSSDAVTEFEVRIEILNDSYADLIKGSTKYPFRPGMTASVDIITEVRKNILTVPLAAVTTRVPKGKKENSERLEDDFDEEELEKGKELAKAEELVEVVFVIEEGVAKQIEVKTGISDFERIQIEKGLEEGMSIVSGPFLAVSKRLKNGSEIKIQNGASEQEEDREKE